jgi:hypothetical protein
VPCEGFPAIVGCAGHREIPLILGPTGVGGVGCGQLGATVVLHARCTPKITHHLRSVTSVAVRSQALAATAQASRAARSTLFAARVRGAKADRLRAPDTDPAIVDSARRMALGASTRPPAGPLNRLTLGLARRLDSPACVVACEHPTATRSDHGPSPSLACPCRMNMPSGGSPCTIATHSLRHESALRLHVSRGRTELSTRATEVL